MAKTETNVSTLKINRGTYAKVQENLSSITENELIITSDKNVPIPTTNDSGKAVVVNASGEYELGNAGTEVVANPTLAGTESALTGLQVGDTKYVVPNGYEVHTYTAGKTYTTNDSDYAQLVEDLTLGRDLVISNIIFSMVRHETSTTWVYSAFGTSAVNGSYSCNVLYITKSGDDYILGNTNPVGLQAVSASNIDGTLYKGLQVGAFTIYNFVGMQTAYVTTAPTANNTSGYLKTVVLTSEPATYYNGYYYIIAPTP